MNFLKKLGILILALVLVYIFYIFLADQGYPKSPIKSVMASLYSTMPTLLDCKNQGGFARNNTSTTYICLKAQNSDEKFDEFHTAFWPSLPKGWSYLAPTGNLQNSDYIFSTQNSDGTKLITCNLAKETCNIVQINEK